MDENESTTPDSEASSTTTSTSFASPFRQRFDCSTRRREAWEQLRKKTPKRPGDNVSIKPRLSGSMDEEKKSSSTTNTTLSLDDEIDDPPECERKLPQHWEKQCYYRIVYRGVVALVSSPDSKSLKTGAYVSYGEVIASQYQVDVEELESVVALPSPLPATKPDESVCSPESPPRSVMSNNAGSVSSLETARTFSSAGAPRLFFHPRQLVTKKAIRVDRVLTGGYAMDATEIAIEPHLGTPKRSNTLPMVGPSPLPLPDSPPSEQFEELPAPKLGYILSTKKNLVLVESMEGPPLIESGKFLYQIVSSTPVQIFTGPCMDAPRTKAVLLPGTIHEVCLRMSSDENVTYLRLSHRRGWIPDRKVTTSGGSVKIGAVPSVKELQANDDVMSMTSSATPGSVMRRRHRPPRRKREQLLNRSRQEDLTMTPRKPSAGGRDVSPLMPMTPSSNISLISDDDDLTSSPNRSRVTTPDRSASRSLTRSFVVEPVEIKRTYFLMRVNAPRGLTILDAPQFQVSNLIHGKTNPSYRPSGESIFLTMPGHHHTTTTAQKVGNPAIFDSVKKQRILPRGAVFEASRRMEKSSSFTQGNGLIKLSDNSGWAIVPAQEDLDIQYRHYHGSVASMKEGEATRAVEEIGNCIIGTDDETDCIWVRVISRLGVTVACPPPFVPVLNDTDSSPTSSAEGSSNGGGSNYGLLRSHDSDVASSVGSAFLDAMFRTPKKASKEDGHRNISHPFYATDPNNNQNAPATMKLVCGSFFQINKWDEADLAGILPLSSQEYVRLRGGQGWVPRTVNKKPVIERIKTPEIRNGSFWFRVLAPRGLKVRLGPSRKATSIKSDNDVHFRFECGEFLRASEVVTFFPDDTPPECFTKLYRNRHLRLQSFQSDTRQLQSIAAPAEWVQVMAENYMYLEECASEPHIERRPTGWRYNVVTEAGTSVRKGPSFSAEVTGLELLPGESVLISERVTPPGECIIWLRLKDGKGWVHDTDQNGGVIMIAHSLRDRTATRTRPNPSDNEQTEELAYNTIIARLFPDETREP